ncbi:MAG: SCP2 sterol-binding domain-containing protein [Candidatus Binatia bacterium]|nr:SCP2 sterol-binding domain-containing protein [Candidatus Binatia bacterium]
MPLAAHEPQAFLSNGWFSLVEALREEIDPPVPEKVRDITINVHITDGPDGHIDARMTAGRFLPGADEAALTRMSMPFDVAKKMFAEGDDQMAMQAMVQGDIKLEGDLSVLMRLQQGGAPTPEAEALQARIREFTV